MWPWKKEKKYEENPFIAAKIKRREWKESYNNSKDGLKHVVDNGFEFPYSNHMILKDLVIRFLKLEDEVKKLKEGERYGKGFKG